ncbi:MAG: sulfotransferase family protein [Fuerstiella sp.]
MLQVIGIGYPRTGTMSQKHALEKLALGPCYHMIEVFRHPQHAQFWMSAIDNHGTSTDWHSVFNGFLSTADAPACHFWKQLAEYYPNAKFILTTREADSWYDSFVTTVYQAMTHPERSPDEEHRHVQQMAKRLILDTMFEGRFEDREFAIRRFHQHNAAVTAAFSKDKLLVFDVADGWDPLCKFLNVPIPNEAFPQSNTREEFQQRFAVPPTQH